MTPITRREIIIVFIDLIIALFAFWFSRYFGDLPRWYWLVLSAVIWVILGGMSRKLQFDSYKRIRYAFTGIFLTGIASGVFLYLFYKHCVPGYEYDYSILLATGLIIVLEWGFYYSIRRLVYRKIPFFYEALSFENITEYGFKGGAKIGADFENKDVKFLLDNTGKHPDFTSWINANRHCFSEKTIIVETANPEDILAYKTDHVELIINTLPLNKIYHINTGLAFSNYVLKEGGFIACHCITSGIRKEKIMRQSPKGINKIIFCFDYLWHRVVPKLSPFNYFYYWITNGERRSLTRVEVLGRFYRAGFEVIGDNIINGKFHVIAVKVKAPIRDDKPSNGLLIRLRRIGKDGKIIGVYKLRTMHAYSEYIQKYVFENSALVNGDKIANDYRINFIGCYLRKFWIDELPQLINLIKGDMKLVGVRPLSQHKFSLYSEKLQKLRIKTKPGLIPPYYYDMPESMEEMETSEYRYLTAYLKSPLLTDWRYFWKAMWNIGVKGKRSK